MVQTTCGISVWVTRLMLRIGTCRLVKHKSSRTLFGTTISKHFAVGRGLCVCVCVCFTQSRVLVSSLYLDTELWALSRAARPNQPFQLLQACQTVFGPGDQTMWNSHHSH